MIFICAAALLLSSSGVESSFMAAMVFKDKAEDTMTTMAEMRKMGRGKWQKKSIMVTLSIGTLKGHVRVRDNNRACVTTSSSLMASTNRRACSAKKSRRR